MEKKINHHAYLIKGGKENLSLLLSIYKEETGEKSVGNPNILIFETVNLSINDAREIKLLAGQSRVRSDIPKWIIIFANFISQEAQQALLKTLEDPIEGTSFFLVTEGVASILPTLKSRLINFELKQSSSDEKFAKKFLSLLPGERIKMISEFLSSNDDLEPALLRSEVLKILNDIESIFSKEISRKLDNAQIRQGNELIRAKDFLHDRSPSVKMLFEHIALVLPVIS